MSLESAPLTYNGDEVIFPPPFDGVHHPEDESAFYRGSTPIDRTYEQYTMAFGIDLSELLPARNGRNPRVLNIGAGLRATFAAEAHERGLDVVSVNPNWQYPQSRAKNEDGSLWSGDGMSVAAVAQELPFADESFDMLVSLWGVPVYLPGTVTEYRKAFREIHRVMGDGAIAIFYPFSWDVACDPRFYTEVLQQEVDAYSVLTGGSYPKLLITKNVHPAVLEPLEIILDMPSEDFAYGSGRQGFNLGTKPF